MKAFFNLILLSILSFSAHATIVRGIVTDESGHPLAYASLNAKGSGKGTTANSEGRFQLELPAGSYTLICQFVGFTRQEKAITVTNTPLDVTFKMKRQETRMNEVIVRSGGEDPAYAIIRNAIKKRPEYETPLDSFTCEAYIKTLAKTRGLPKRILGQKIDDKDKKEMGVDSAGKGIIYLSESLTKIAFKAPERMKLEVISGRESGGGGYGFNFPTFIDFYSNNVTVITSQFAPRGFVSPIADGALKYYRYKYLGSFWENGMEITQIKVMPRRNYEPLFTGTINISEGDWHIHSLELQLTKESQLQLMDTLQIRQIHAPIAGAANVWRTQNQSVYYTFKLLGIDAVGTFLNVYNKYDIRPVFPKNYFNKVVMAYDTAVNKHPREYWDSIRPVQLEPEELRDYKVKDSIYKQQRDSAGSKTVRDSLRKHQGKITLPKVFYSGFSRSDFHPEHPTWFSWSGPLKMLQYNTVEGIVTNFQATLSKTWKPQKKYLSFTPHVRYGINNRHMNPWASLTYATLSEATEGDVQTAKNYWVLSGGKRVSQFNKAEPISPLLNSIYTLLEHRNYMKIYENYFTSLRFIKRLENDIRIDASVLYENRLPIDNTTDYSFFKKDRQFTPNYPFEQLSQQFTQHQAVVASVELQYRPGQRYIQYPKRKVAIGSKYPVLALAYTKGINSVLGSDVDYDKWRFSVWDDMNFKLLGLLKYRFNMGGFLNANKVAIQDYQHFNGNQLVLASQYLNSFQLAPYYANSTTASFYMQAHAEHHFNGLLTNKIPLFKKLNWNLVAGANAFWVNSNNHYTEIFAGLENIFKILRVDVVNGYLSGQKGTWGVRIGFGGLLGGSININ